MSQKIFRPLNRNQADFLASTCHEVLLEGGRGGGKSFMLMMDAAYKAREYYKDKHTKKLIVSRISIDYPKYKALILRRNEKDLNTLIDIGNELYPPIGGKWVSSKLRWVFPSGAYIQLGQVDSQAQVETKCKGGNWEYLGIDEASHFKQEWVIQLYQIVRTDIPKFKTFKRLTSNPGSTWLKRRFIDTCKKRKGKKRQIPELGLEWTENLMSHRYKDKDGLERLRIPLSPLDNDVFTNPETSNDFQYIRSLMALHEPLRSMWLFGDWSTEIGEFLGSWNSLIHVITDADEFNIQRDKHKYSIYRAIDYGTTKPFVCLFLAVDESKNVIIFDEVVKTNCSVTPQAKAIQEKMEELGLTEDDIKSTICDPAMRIKSLELGETPVNPTRIYHEVGLRKIQYGINDRISGAMLVREYFNVDNDGRTKTRITFNCKYVIQSFPLLMIDANKIQRGVEDVDTTGDDHAYDAYRYALTIIAGFTRGMVKKGKQSWRDKLKSKQSVHKKLDNGRTLCPF